MSKIEASIQTPDNFSKARCLALALMGRSARKAGEREAKHGSISAARVMIDALTAHNLSSLPELDEETHAIIKTVTNQSALWHGTGRYQYKHSGEVVDVIRDVATNGEVATNYDAYDIGAGPMHSISLAKSRMYARTYADMHLDYRSLSARPERYGSAIFWASIFIGDWALEFAQERGGYRKARDQMREAGSDSWHNKISSRPLDIRAGFTQGSDISNNYPVLLGIDSVESRPISGSFALHEVRTSSPISLSHIVHIEVPRDRIAETDALFTEHGNYRPTIVAIEDAERYASRFSFSELMGIRPVNIPAPTARNKGDLTETEMYKMCEAFVPTM